MPIYMYRHEMEGATAKAVADAHQIDLKLQDKFGICAGEPVEEDHRLFGSTIQLTSRICDQAQPDQILVTSVIRDLCLGKKFVFGDRGEVKLKGFDQPQKNYEVQWR
jgi:class 3 adenylate cyclase